MWILGVEETHGVENRGNPKCGMRVETTVSLHARPLWLNESAAGTVNTSDNMSHGKRTGA